MKSDPGCLCPDVPNVDEPIDGVLRCACCGGVIELTCKGKCGPEHVHAAFKAARAKLREINPALRVKPPAPPRGADKKKRHYRDKPCKGDGCGAIFTPAGPRDDFCLKCRKGKVAP